MCMLFLELACGAVDRIKLALEKDQTVLAARVVQCLPPGNVGPGPVLNSLCKHVFKMCGEWRCISAPT